MKFNIRVYALIIHEGGILLSDEFRLSTRMTKFPGGGLEPGEGTLDCLRREIWEELGQKVIETKHFYTTDFFQPAYLLPEQEQLISIYYLTEIEAPEELVCVRKPFDYEYEVEGAQCFRWMSLQNLSGDTLSFPIDKRVVELLRSSYFKI
jgi:8-oxo-dGTP pyrophosphatase MutT (NUDIX family)